MARPRPRRLGAAAPGAINAELSAAYGLPIDVTAKLGGPAAVARALDRGKVALAQIAALQLHFPDVPPLGKAGRSEVETAALAALLHWGGALEPERALVKAALK